MGTPRREGETDFYQEHVSSKPFQRLWQRGREKFWDGVTWTVDTRIGRKVRVMGAKVEEGVWDFTNRPLVAPAVVGAGIASMVLIAGTGLHIIGATGLGIDSKEIAKMYTSYFIPVAGGVVAIGAVVGEVVGLVRGRNRNNPGGPKITYGSAYDGPCYGEPYRRNR